MRKRMSPTSVVLTMAAVLALHAPPSMQAQEQAREIEPPPQTEAWILDSNNWQLGKDLLPQPVLNRVRNGDYWYRVIHVDPVKFKQNYSQEFWAASEANAQKYDLDPATCGLRDKATGKMPDFFFGYPFPKIDSADPQAGCKIAWNFRAAGWQGKGGGATFTLNGISTGGEFKRVKMSIDRMTFLGRHGGPIDNPDSLRSTDIINLIEPHDVDGVAGLSQRTNDWHSQDKVWFYVPTTRRVRRVNAATRSDPALGLDLFADDIDCYAGKVEYYRWKLIGEGKVLAPVLQPYPFRQRQVGDTRWEIGIPYLKGGYEVPGAKGVPWLIVENLVFIIRPVWIVEGQSDDPFYNFGKVIMYFDKDMYRIYWKLVHNRAGEYFYNAQCSYHWTQSDDGNFSSVAQNSVVGVNDKTNRAGLGGRYSSQYIEFEFEKDHFTLHHLSHITD